MNKHQSQVRWPMITCWVFQIQGLNHIYLQWRKVTKYIFSILTFSDILLLHFSSPIWFHATLYTSALLHFSFFRSLLPSLLSVTSCSFVFFNRCLHGLSFYLVLWSVKLSKLQEAVTTPRPQDWAHWFLVFLSQQMHHRFNSYFDKSEASPVQTGLIYLRLQSATWRLWNESEQQTFGSPLIYR